MPITITNERYEQLLWLWGEETNDPDTQDWRDELLPNERKLVDSWDHSALLGVKAMCQRILELEEQSAARWRTPFVQDAEAT